MVVIGIPLLYFSNDVLGGVALLKKFHVGQKLLEHTGDRSMSIT